MRRSRPPNVIRQVDSYRGRADSHEAGNVPQGRSLYWCESDPSAPGVETWQRRAHLFSLLVAPLGYFRFGISAAQAPKYLCVFWMSTRLRRMMMILARGWRGDKFPQSFLPKEEKTLSWIHRGAFQPATHERVNHTQQQSCHARRRVTIPESQPASLPACLPAATRTPPCHTQTTSKPQVAEPGG